MSNMGRCEIFAHYILDNNTTIRKTANYFKISKSTVHNDVSNKLKEKNYELYLLVKRVLEKNFSEKHLRGGESTKRKYKNLKK